VVYLDDGSGTLDAADTPVATVTDFAAITTNGSGVLDIPISDGDANFQVDVGSSRTFLVALKATPMAPTSSSAKLIHRTLDVGTTPLPMTAAEDANADIPASTASAENVESTPVEFFLSTASCESAGELNLEGVTVVTTLVCTAGTTLDAGDGFTVDSPGDVTFQAGDSVRLGDGFSISGDKLTVTVNPALKP